MLVVRNNIGGISRKSTIHKLIIIMVGRYKMKAEIGIYQLYEIAFQ